MSKTIGIETEIRPGRPEDLNFVFATLLRSYKSDSYFAMRIPDTLFYLCHHKVVEHILAKPATKLSIITPVDEPNTILGYLLIEKYAKKDVVHFCYVKSPFRRYGLATKLFQAADVPLDEPDRCWFTHWTKLCNELTKKHSNLIYNPYAL